MYLVSLEMGCLAWLEKLWELLRLGFGASFLIMLINLWFRHSDFFSILGVLDLWGLLSGSPIVFFLSKEKEACDMGDCFIWLIWGDGEGIVGIGRN